MHQSIETGSEELRALVIGGTSGIGARTAELLAARGCRVAIAGRRQEAGEELASRLGKTAGFVRCNVTMESEVAHAVAAAVDRFGGLDALVNTAGGGVPEPRGIAAADIETVEATLRVHVVGVVAAMKHVAPVMIGQRSGSIVNIASVGGLVAGWSALGYSAAKAALILDSLVRPWQPYPRMGTADDVARAAVWLASEGSAYVNGHDLVVDGGIAAGRPLSVSEGSRAKINAALGAA